MAVRRQLTWIADDAPPDAFPPPDTALEEPNGLLAAGGDLSTERLRAAYRRGIFPWYSEGQPVLWWCPDPRTVLYPARFKISRSLRKALRRAGVRLTVDRCFADVVEGCAAARDHQGGTWITGEMAAAYIVLHGSGHAHSVECWCEDVLVGGLYGVSLGRVFFGESMFSRARDASKMALAALTNLGYRLIDCQMPTAHLFSLGAVSVPRTEFLRLLNRWCDVPSPAFPLDIAGVRALRAGDPRDRRDRE